jgi:signal transduction histidine kinase
VKEAEVGERPLEVEVEPMVADVDPTKVERILENLLVNAVRHTQEGTPIWLRVSGDAEGVLLVVEDAGPGVPAKDREAIFQPFRQGSDAPAHAPGTGIGLSVVAQFAELHGGRAWVEERDGGGASFRVLLPVSAG